MQIGVDKSRIFKPGFGEVGIWPLASVELDVVDLAVGEIGPLKVAAGKGAILDAKLCGLYHRKGAVFEDAVLHSGPFKPGQH